MRQLGRRVWDAVKYAAARGRRAIGATLGAATGQVVTRWADEWFGIEELDPSIAGVIAIVLAAAGTWITKENAPKRPKARTRS